LLAAVEEIITPMTSTSEKPVGMQREIKADDLHLVCWEYVWS
jgi:hypothetical protein